VNASGRSIFGKKKPQEPGPQRPRVAGCVAARIFDLSSCAWRAYKKLKFPDNVNPAHAVCPFQGPGKACPSDQETKDV
jgi:hypothetical protein